MIWHLNDDKSVFVSNKVIIFEINFQFSIGKVENFLAENHTLLSDLLRLCKMFIYIPLTWFWSRRWLCVGWKSKKSPKNHKSCSFNYESPMSHTSMSHTSFESQYSELFEFEIKFSDWPPGGAGEPIEKNKWYRSVAPPREWID